MTKYILIRHGQAGYQEVDERGFIGQGRDMAPLTDLGVHQIKEAVQDPCLKDCDILLSSPYTRALQSAAIISKEIGLDIQVEVDLHEWLPDMVNFQHKSTEESFVLAKDYMKHGGVHPENEDKVWESKEHLKTRVLNVLDRYSHLDKVIVVCHGMVINALTDQKLVKNGELVEWIL